MRKPKQPPFRQSIGHLKTNRQIPVRIRPQLWHKKYRLPKIAPRLYPPKILCLPLILNPLAILPILRLWRFSHLILFSLLLPRRLLLNLIRLITRLHILINCHPLTVHRRIIIIITKNRRPKIIQKIITNTRKINTPIPTLLINIPAISLKASLALPAITIVKIIQTITEIPTMTLNSIKRSIIHRRNHLCHRLLPVLSLYLNPPFLLISWFQLIPKRLKTNIKHLIRVRHSYISLLRHYPVLLHKHKIASYPSSKFLLHPKL